MLELQVQPRILCFQNQIAIGRRLNMTAYILELDSKGKYMNQRISWLNLLSIF